MSRSLSFIEIKTLSFSDAKLHRFIFSEDKLTFYCDFFYSESRGLQDSMIECVIAGCKNIRITRFDKHGKNPKLVDRKSSGSIREICEWRIEDSSLMLAGFELESGVWQTYELDFTSFIATY